MKRDAKHVACEGAEEILWAKYKARERVCWFKVEAESGGNTE